MMKRKTFLLVTFVLITVFTMASLVSAAEMTESTDSIYDIASSNSDFEQLTAAVDAAGLKGTLESSGPFTVFAPTDDAFAAFAASGIDVETSLENVLLYHVVPGSVPASDVVSSSALATAFGKDINVSVSGGKVILDGIATVIATDIMASNGIIHVIDAVLPPPVNALDLSPLGDPNKSIAEVATADGRFTTLLAALSAAGLAETFAADGNYTVFAPTDDVFAALPDGTVESLLADPQGALTDILTYHVVNDTLSINQLANASGSWLTTLQGGTLQVSTNESVNVFVDGCQVTPFNIQASNGVIQVIDCVLMP